MPAPAPSIEDIAQAIDKFNVAKAANNKLVPAALEEVSAALTALKTTDADALVAKLKEFNSARALIAGNGKAGAQRSRTTAVKPIHVANLQKIAEVLPEAAKLIKAGRPTSKTPIILKHLPALAAAYNDAVARVTGAERIDVEAITIAVRPADFGVAKARTTPENGDGNGGPGTPDGREPEAVTVGAVAK